MKKESISVCCKHYLQARLKFGNGFFGNDFYAKKVNERADGSLVLFAVYYPESGEEHYFFLIAASVDQDGGYRGSILEDWRLCMEKYVSFIGDKYVEVPHRVVPETTEEKIRRINDSFQGLSRYHRCEEPSGPLFADEEEMQDFLRSMVRVSGSRRIASRGKGWDAGV